MAATVTPLLEAPLLAAGQAQKHVTHNEALILLDALVHLSVESAAAAPASPAQGARYIVPAAAMGAWAGQDDKIAQWLDDGWRFHTPRKGWVATLPDRSQRVHDGVQWANVQATSATTFGINATATATNRLSVASAATLLTHDGADHRLNINKAGAPQTASLVMQSGYSGRAEIGLSGTDNLSIKVSPDGVQWREAVKIDNADGSIAIGGSAQPGRLDIVGPANGRAASFSGGTQQLTVEVYGSIGYLWHRGGHVVFGTYNAFDLILGSSNLERARLTAAGRLGIGTSTPTASLDVAGPARVGQYAKAAMPGAAATGAGALIYVQDDIGGPVIAFSDGTAWRRVTDRAVIS